MSDELELTIGSAVDFDVFLYDEKDVALALSDVAKASLIVKDGYAGATVLSLDTTALTLTVDAVNKKLVGSISQVAADALVAGLYVGEAALKFTSTGKWKHTDPFIVRVSRAAAPHIP